MAISIGDALLKLGVDTSDLEKDLNKASGKVDDAFNKWGKRAAIAGGVIVGAVLAIGGAATKMAMEAVESENLFEVAMGDMAASTRAWSKELSDALGLNEFEVRKNVSTIYVMLESMGLAETAAEGMSQKVTELAVDMASFYNITEQDAFLKLRAGLTGEAEPLKRMGILVDENTVKMAAYQNGIAEAGKELTAQQKVEARYIAILEQTSKAQGDKARTMESPTNMLRTYKNQVAETATALGMKLLPAFTKLLGMVKPIVDGLGMLVDKHGDLAVVLLAIAGGGGALLLFLGLLPKMIAMFGAVGQGITLFKVALTALRAAFLTTQLSAVAMWAGITLGVSLAIAAGIALWQNWDKVSAWLAKVWEDIKYIFLKGVYSMLDSLSKFTSIIPPLNKLVDTAKKKIETMMEPEKLRRQAEESAKAFDKLIEGISKRIEVLEEEKGALAEKHEAELDAIREEYAGYDELIEFKIAAAKEVQQAESDALDERISNAERAHGALLRQEEGYKEYATQRLNDLLVEYKKAIEERRKADLDGIEERRTLAQKEYDDAVKAINDEYGEFEEVEGLKTQSKADAARERVQITKDGYDKEIQAAKDAYDEEIRLMYDTMVTKKLLAYDEDIQNQVKAIQQEIDAIDAQTDAENLAKTRADEQQRLMELKAAVDSAETEEAKAEATKKYEEYATDVKRNELLRQRAAEKESLRTEIDQIRDNAKIDRDALEVELKTEYDKKKEAADKIYNEITVPDLMKSIATRKREVDLALEQELKDIEKNRLDKLDVLAKEYRNEDGTGIFDLMDAEEIERKAFYDQQKLDVAKQVADINTTYKDLKTQYDIYVVTHEVTVHEGSGNAEPSGYSGGGGGISGAVHAQEGLIAMSPMLAHIGELAPRIPEVVAPLDKLRDMLFSRGGQSADIRIYFDGQLMAEKLGAPLVDIIRVKTGVSI